MNCSLGNMIIFDNGFHEIIVLLQFLKMLLPWLITFGKLMENLIAMNDFKDLENFIDDCTMILVITSSCDDVCVTCGYPSL